MRDIDAVVIAASTGGPKALVSLISNLPEKIKVPIFIVQHMPKDFTTSFAGRLDRESKIKVVEAENNSFIKSNMVYLAPGDYHMIIGRHRIKLNQGEKLHGVRPAADYLFKAAAEVYESRLLGIVLTGMGKDGSLGMEAIKERGGYNIAQNKESSVVFGMPASAIGKGLVDEVLSLEDISKTLNEMVRE